MRVETTSLHDVLLFVPEPFQDERGWFSRTFDTAIFDAAVTGVRAADFTQDSQSRSHRGVVRGMHGRGGRGEAKLVRCAHGSVLDVLVDIRPDSPTFGQQAAFELDDVRLAHLYVPPGLLHGYQVTSDAADVCYRIDRPHAPGEDIGVAFDDPDLAIAWPEPITIVSARDRAAGSWAGLRSSLG
ncbi:dTDP-4-dehydrorhamnose 3,5-epimerase family protein [Aeromicrobium wangtongii]|uniref:dTDP-4-dehydrorhamnose 3,5-epimerase family protein n=1 Tax=Aeromicrobium wangtongii TaxID=2969247 RepID=UPI0020183AF8|nr:dTDP-4-dehydrorhamnose 3,5-epimerase [Aeromicrobium wangtongii]MCL3819890.1 dTDP-4-dehydrorhamnose 3,5-epimerase [Aeromicrobium wangtongii]